MLDLNRSVGKKKYPVKTTVNLAMREKKKGGNTYVVPAAIILAALIALFCRFGVVGPLAKAASAESLEAQESATLESLQAANADYDTVLAKYQSLDISSASVTGTMQPMECLALIDDNLVKSSKVESYTVAQSVITAKISGVTLNSISGIYKSLMAYDSVENVQIYTAATGEAGSGTTATLTIKLVSADDGSADSASGTDAASGAEGGGQ
jgi:hypothetical protein